MNPNNRVAAVWPPAAATETTRTAPQLGRADDVTSVAQNRARGTHTVNTPTQNHVGAGARLGTSVQADRIENVTIFTSQAVHTPQRPVPRELPPRAGRYVNRTRDLDALSTLFATVDDQAPGLIVVTGAAGLGKTSLVQRWLQQQDETIQWPDGTLYTALGGHSTGSVVPTQHALASLLRSVSPEVPPDFQQQLALWRSYTSRLRLVVLLDDAYSAEQIRPLLPTAPTCLTIVTSRHLLPSLALCDARYHLLDPLDAQATIELLRTTAGTPATDAELARLAQTCAGSPLKARLSAAQLTLRPEQTRRAITAQPDQHSQPADSGGEGDQSVDWIQQAYQGLSEETARVYRCLGLVTAGPISAPQLAAGCNLTLATTSAHLRHLRELNLLEDAGNGRFQVHDLVLAHTRRERARHPAGEQTAQEFMRRMIEWYLAACTLVQRKTTASQASGLPARDYHYPVPTALLPSHPDRPAALTWINNERHHLVEAIRTAASAGWHALTYQLTDATWPLWLHHRYYDWWIEVHQLALQAAIKAAHPKAIRQMHTSLAIGLNASGQHQQAESLYKEAIADAVRAGDVRDHGQALMGLAGTRIDDGRPAEADAPLAEAIVCFGKAGYPRGVALALLTQATARGDRQQLVDAVQAAQRAWQMLIELGEPEVHEAARARAHLGYYQAGLPSRYEEGMAHLNAALRQFENGSSAQWRARTHAMLAERALQHDDVDTAVLHYRRALTIYDGISPRDAEHIRRILYYMGQPLQP